jgi:alkyl hydroperoxide reductase subunit AhpC
MIGEKAPDFTLSGYFNNEYVEQTLSKDYKDKRVVLVFYPHDFTFVCPTEVLGFSEANEEFEKLDTKIIFISCDSKYVHKAWIEQSPENGGVKGNIYPMLSDVNRKVATAFNMLNKISDVSYRGTIILDKKHEIRSFTIYDDLIGRSVDEVLRIVDNVKFLEENKNEGIFCPINFRASKETKK